MQGALWLVHLVLVPVCFVMAWGMVGLVAWNLISAGRDGLAQAQQMHKIPCSECRFFTGDYHLKCTVHPERALSEEAMNCADYEPQRWG
ncbi:hypothetical protein HPC62_04570 [Thermoleptolyngbya sichuanensis A183]|uniref:Uncharacterized protein n=1 Tax=Thermoleptolyngbya sichuanensis A183 TaxID=2737172 RepID=A0A6M8BBR5_9CYAN|nr:hypothetical protein HPC62_04570 [Thermoleptolyngbya sichuanensis A183]